MKMGGRLIKTIVKWCWVPLSGHMTAPDVARLPSFNSKIAWSIEDLDKPSKSIPKCPF